MDIERMKKLLKSKIEVGKKVNEVREVVKNYNKEKQDMYDYTEKLFKPSIKAQKNIKKAIDDKQDELINQIQINDELANMKQNQVIAKLQQNNNKQDEIITNIQENQKALTKGLYDLIEPYQREIIFRDELPKMIEDKGSDDEADKVEPSTSKMKSDLDIGFSSEEIKKLTNRNLPPPSIILKSHLDNTINLNEFIKELGEKTKELGRKKGYLSKKSSKTKNKEKISDLSDEIRLLQKYKKRIDIIEEGAKTVGTGIYTQKKRNAYKISQNGQYGGLVIDLPKLYGHLKVVAHKNGQKVYDKQADFDTLDLLTKRFNNKKKYSELARSVFNDLNRLSEIPIHRTSKKYSKLRSGVVYYHNPQDLLSRLELLGGSMSAGNNSNDIREEFVNIAHMLNKLKVINNKQMNDIIKNYLL